MNIFEGLSDDLLCFFVSTATIYGRTTGKNIDGTVSNAYTVKLANIKVAKMSTSNSLKYIGNRNNPDVDSHIVINPKDIIGITLLKSDKVDVDGVEYAFVDIENSMNMDSLIKVSLKRFLNG